MLFPNFSWKPGCSLWPPSGDRRIWMIFPSLISICASSTTWRAWAVQMDNRRCSSNQVRGREVVSRWQRQEVEDLLGSNFISSNVHYRLTLLDQWPSTICREFESPAGFVLDLWTVKPLFLQSYRYVTLIRNCSTSFCYNILPLTLTPAWTDYSMGPVVLCDVLPLDLFPVS